MKAYSNHALIPALDPDKIGFLAQRGSLWTLSLLVLRQTISIAVTVVLARILSPTDYGLIGMVAAVTAFFQVFSDLGLSWIAVQERQITRAHLDNLFWVNALAGAALWASCAAVGPSLNRFYGRTELAGIALALGAGFFLTSLAVQPAALMRRQMRLKELGLSQTAAHTAGAISGVVLAGFGARYWALVGQSLIMQASLLLALFVQTRYLPGIPKREKGTGRLLSLGGFLAVFALADYVARTIDNILLGKMWGPQELGYYSRAYFLMMLPAYMAIGSLTAAIVPALSALKDEPARLEAAYRKALLVAVLVAFPFATGIVVSAHEAIPVIYGDQWTPAVPMLIGLSVGALGQPICATTDWLLTAMGRGLDLMLYGIMMACVVTAAVFIGVSRGGVGLSVAVGLTLTFLVAIPGLAYSHRVAGFSFVKTALPLLGTLVASMAMAACVFLTGHLLSVNGCAVLTVLAAKIIVGVAAYPSFLIFLRGYPAPIRELREKLDLCREFGMGRALQSVYWLAGAA